MVGRYKPVGNRSIIHVRSLQPVMWNEAQYASDVDPFEDAIKEVSNLLCLFTLRQPLSSSNVVALSRTILPLVISWTEPCKHLGRDKSQCVHRNPRICTEFKLWALLYGSIEEMRGEVGRRSSGLQWMRIWGISNELVSFCHQPHTQYGFSWFKAF